MRANVRSINEAVKSKTKTKTAAIRSRTTELKQHFLNNLHMIYTQECTTTCTVIYFNIFRHKFMWKNTEYMQFCSPHHILKVTHTHSERVLRSPKLRSWCFGAHGLQTIKTFQFFKFLFSLINQEHLCYTFSKTDDTYLHKKISSPGSHVPFNLKQLIL